MAKKRNDLGNDTYFTVFNSDFKLIKDPVKKILFSKIKDWILRNEDKKSKYHIKDGYYWTFGSYVYWAGECGLEPKTVGTHLRELVGSGILKTGNYNRLKIDKTIWYRLATNEEMNNVNFRFLYYGKTKNNNIDYHSNETFFEMYKNGMINENIEDIDKVKMGAPILEHIAEHNSKHSSEDSLKNNLEHITNKNCIKIEEYNKIFNDGDILIHIDHLTKIDIEDIPIEIIKSFIIKFLDINFNSIENSLEYYKY